MAGEAALTAESAEAALSKLQLFFAGIALESSALEGPTQQAVAAASAAAAAALAAKEAALETARPSLAFEAQRYLALVQVDTLWKGHVKAMNNVKDFAGLRAYASEDPLDVYRDEGLKLYASMQAGRRQNTIYSFFQYKPTAAAKPS